MPRILLANEFGAGRGHLVTLCRVGLAMGQGFEFDAALCRREFEQELAPLNAQVFPGPALTYRVDRRIGPDRVPTSTWGEYLGDLGFDSVSRIREIVLWWRQVLTSRRIDLLIGEYAPLALLAARTLGVPTLSAGQGYGLPPPEMPCFPVLDPRHTEHLHDEGQLLAHVNTVAVECGLAPLLSLPEVYHASLPLVLTVPPLDPYRDWRRCDYVHPVSDIGTLADSTGDEVYVYFSTQELESPAVLDALLRLPLPRRGFLPTVSADVAQRLVASGMVLEPAPIPVEDIVRRSRLLLNAGQHGTVCLGLFSGLAQVALPQHMEQLSNARLAQATGAVRLMGAEDWQADRLIEGIVAAYGDTALHAAAHRVAVALRASTGGANERTVSQAVAPIRQALLAGKAVAT